MSRRTSPRHRRRPTGALGRFFAALVALVALLIGVPVLLVVCSKVGLGASHPIPGIGTTDEIRAFFERDLTPTEIAPIAMRTLLIVGWVLWLAMAVSITSSVLEARGSGLRTALPQFAMFVALGRWIAAGLAAVSTLAPNFVSAGSLESPRPFTVSSAMPAASTAVEAPVRPGFARVLRGESVETFAQRTIGDATRWSEIWELNRDQTVGQAGETWSVAWKLTAGWDLRLPTDVVSTPGAWPGFRSAVVAGTDAETTERSRGHVVVSGQSYWSIARSQLGDDASGTAVWDYTEALMEMNAPRLGYDDPAMLKPGDVVELADAVVTPVLTTSIGPGASPGTTPAVPQVTAEAGDSYWAIAESALGESAPTTDVVDLTNDLVDLNSPLLGYPERPMIHPGDTVFLQDPANFEVPVTEPAVAVPATRPMDPGIDELVPGELVAGALDTAPTTTAPATTTTTTTTSTTVPPAVAPDPPAATDVAGRPGAPLPIGVGEAALLATGVVALLGARRRARLRAAEPPARLPLPRPEIASTERMLRRIDDSERLLRVDIALRAAAAAITDFEHRVIVVRSSPDGTIELTMSGSVTLVEPWIGSGRNWTLSRSVPVDDLAAASRTVGVPCIALVQIGVDDEGWDVLVDLEAVGLLAVDADAPTADSVVSAVAVGLASSEFAEVSHLVGVGLDDTAFLGHRQAHLVESLDEGVELAVTLVGATVSAKRSTFTLRARHTGGEMWEPAVVLVASEQAAAMAPGIATTLAGRSGVAMVVGGSIPGAVWNLHPDGQMWRLDPLGIRLLPVGSESSELDGLVDLIAGDPVASEPEAESDLVPERHSLFATDDSHMVVMDVNRAQATDAVAVPTAVFAPVVAEPLTDWNGNGDWSGPTGNGNGNGSDGTGGHRQRKGSSTLHSPSPRAADPDEPDEPDDPDEFADPPWSMMVRVMGAVDVVDSAGVAARFERSKTLELLAWMVTHRSNSTRTAARTSLWDQDVRDATFANVVSEARRAMARHVEPPADDEWLRRTLTSELSLHDLVLSDADLVRARFQAGRAKSGKEALSILAPAVELVRELPFTGMSYLWPETEGISSNLVLLATNVTAEYAKRALADGDFEGVFWSTGRGLQVLSGQEALIGLRMRAHAEAGDLSGVRHEWECYERVINSDPWSDGEPAPKLVALRCELLSK